MAKEYAYRLQSTPQAAQDGSGAVHHDIFAIYREVGSGIAWKDAPVVPGYHKTIVVPGAEVKIVMDMPHATGPQKQAKDAAYKQALVDNRNTPATPLIAPAAFDWSPAGIDAYLMAYEAWQAAFDAANAVAATEATRVNDYVTAVLSLSFPLEFQV